MNDTTTCCAPTAPVADPPAQTDLYERLALTAKALGHPIRVQIMAILLARESCICGEIVDVLPIAQATVSQHLKVLKEAGLVRGEIDGPRVCYCADDDALRHHGDLVAALAEHGRAPAGVGER